MTFSDRELVGFVAGRESRVEMPKIGGVVGLPDSFAVGRRARVDKATRGRTRSERGESERGGKTELDI
jgi:hypothetical protein